MALRKRSRRTQTTLAFESLTIEGSLLSADWLARVAQLLAGGQSEVDYRVPRGLNLRDEIGRYWRIAQALWHDFDTGRVPAVADFVVPVLREAFGFASLQPAAPVELSGHLYPIGWAALGGLVPVVVAGARGGLDAALAELGDGGRRRSPFGLAQELLNASDEAVWGLASDGARLRILRDNASLTRPAWLEADLARIFAEERYADFAALWLLAHETRFGIAGRPAADCPLELWRAAGREEGTRAREELRLGVEEALIALGQGFLSHPDNLELRRSLEDGSLGLGAYFQQLLRLVYRLIFLLTAEERELLHPPGSDQAARQLYGEGYGLRRLRERTLRRAAHDRSRDLWESLLIVFRGVARGESALALPALGGLFAADQCGALDTAKLENRALLTAVFRLTWLKAESGLARVNWRDMGPEELGSVYESLLELVPQLSGGGRVFGFAAGGETKGHARKLTGSYYTPDSLVQMLLDSALEPVIEATLAANREHPVAALLSLTVLDPACGSGHFLLGAARRLAGHVARLECSGTPSAAEYRRALRAVVGRCVFGVDKNPLAIELARTALWLEAMTPELPLTFVDHHLVCGDALIGLVDLGVLADGIPAEAFKALSGDDKEVVKGLAKRNRDDLKRLKALRGQATLPMPEDGSAEAMRRLDVLPDDTLEAVAAKQAALARTQAEAHDARSHPAALAADLFVAAFLSPKTKETESAIPVTRMLTELATGMPIAPAVEAHARALAERMRVLHWKLAFAQVFARGGFDCVLGNPPWERIKLQEQEFFASRDVGIAQARNQSERHGRIDSLRKAAAGTPERKLYQEFEEAKHAADASSLFAHDAGRFPLTGTGDVNTYALFAETALQLIAPGGRAGIIVPTGIATDDSTKEFFSHLSNKRLVRFISFENEERIFSSVHHAFKFALLVSAGQQGIEAARYSFFLRQPEQARDARRQFSLSVVDVVRLNPNTRTAATFRTSVDAELTKKIYSRVPVLWDEGRPDGNPWGIKFGTLFHMSNDSSLFRIAARRHELADPVPLYEAKMIHQFDHRWATYAGDEEDGARDVTDAEKADPAFAVTPRYWVEREEVERRLAEKGWTRPWLMGWRDIARSTDMRTLIASVVPRTACGDKILAFDVAHGWELALSLVSAMNSLVVDYVSRQKVGGSSLKYFTMRQLPFPHPDSLSPAATAFISSRAAELVCTGQDLSGLAGLAGVAAIWNPERRSVLRAELDAYFAALYGLTRDELRYILDPTDVMGPDFPSETFRVLKEKELRLYGEYRTRRLVLEAWDRLSQSGELPAPVGPRP